MIRAAIVWLLTACSAQAGAWGRDEGDLFLSFGGNVALFGDAVRPVYYDPTIYLEYGLTDSLTIGFDGYTADRGEAGSILVYGRYALDDDVGPDRWAVSLAAGYTLLPSGMLDETARFGLHWGRGLAEGWAAADASATLLLSGEAQYKIDASWGQALTDRFTTVLDVEAGIGLTGDYYAKVTPSIVAELGPALQVRVGLVQALTGDRGGGLLMQGWVEF